MDVRLLWPVQAFHAALRIKLSNLFTSLGFGGTLFSAPLEVKFGSGKTYQ